jgi:anthranilate synthase component II
VPAWDDNDAIQMILLIDNYDSFVFNLARHFERLGQETLVVRNDAIGVPEIVRLAPDAIVISPGPCTPSAAGCSVDVVQQLHQDFPLLGICLGHQAIGAALGARIVRANEPLHGRTSVIRHNGLGEFAGLSNPLSVCRYHSLAIDEATLPSAIEVTARASDGTIMAIAHRHLPVVGLQFHPEAILTESGYEILAGFLRRCDLDAANPIGLALSERAPEQVARPLPVAPVTF